MMIGKVTNIIRHPVKSFTGENLQQAKVMSYGIYGDRSHTFVQKANNKHLTITQFPNMVTYKARFVGTEQEDTYPKIEVIASDKKKYDWYDDELLARINQESKKEVEREVYEPSFVPFPALEVDNLLMISQQSLAKLEDTYEENVDERRFRGNIIFDLDEEWTESMLIGKTLQIGNEVSVQMNKFCERCMIISVDPVTGAREPKFLKHVVKKYENLFGVYASVIHTGEIKIGDPIYLL